MESSHYRHIAPFIRFVVYIQITVLKIVECVSFNSAMILFQ